MLEKYKNSDGFSESIETLVDRVRSEVTGSIKRALKAETNPAPSDLALQKSSSALPSPNPQRTQSSPEWNGDKVVDLQKTVVFTAISLNDFQSNQEPLACTFVHGVCAFHQISRTQDCSGTTSGQANRSAADHHKEREPLVA